MIPRRADGDRRKAKDRLGGRGRSVVCVAYPGAFHENSPGMADWKLEVQGTGPW